MIRNTNTVRLYLKCTFASDITDITNGSLLDDMIHGTAPRATTEVYPAQDRPSDDAFKDWKHTIYTSFVHGTDGARNVRIPIPTNPRLAPTVFPNFQSYLRSQSDAVQGFLGDGLDNYTDAELQSFATSLSSCDGISIFGDGSVKEGHGAHTSKSSGKLTHLRNISQQETPIPTSRPSSFDLYDLSSPAPIQH